MLVLAATAAALLPMYLPPSTQGTTVLVAATDLPAGTVLTPEHLRAVEIAEELMPEGTASTADAVAGSTTALPLRAGTPLLPGMLREHSPSAVPEGSVLMLVPAPAALATHLGPGSRIELLTTDLATGSTGSLVAQVLAPAASAASTPQVSLGGPGADAGPGSGAVQLLVAVDREDSRELAHALAGGTTTVSIID